MGSLTFDPGKSQPRAHPPFSIYSTDGWLLASNNLLCFFLYEKNNQSPKVANKVFESQYKERKVKEPTKMQINVQCP